MKGGMAEKGPGITRSSTVDPYLNAQQGADSTAAKLQRNSSNADILSKKGSAGNLKGSVLQQQHLHQQQQQVGSGGLQRSFSLNTRDMTSMDDLSHNFSRVMSVNNPQEHQGQHQHGHGGGNKSNVQLDMRHIDVPPQQGLMQDSHSSDIGQQGYYSQSQGGALPSYGMYPTYTPVMTGINPYYAGMGSFDATGGLFNSPRLDSYGRHPSEISNTPHAVTSTMNQVFTPMFQPHYHPMGGQMMSPQFTGMSPYPYGMGMAPPGSSANFSPFISNLATPNTSNLNNFALPMSGVGEPSSNVRSLHGNIRDMNFLPQTSPMVAYNDFMGGIERTKGDMMLEELRMKLKNHPSAANIGGAPPGGGRQNMQMTSLTNSPGGGNVYQEVGITWNLNDIKGFVHDFAKDQFGSRFIQYKLADEKVPKIEKDELFKELAPIITLLCKDVFGNYVVQKLLDISVGTPDQHNFIFRTAIKGHMYELSTHMYGCRVIQKLIEQIMGHTSMKIQDAMAGGLSEADALKKLKGDAKNDNVYDVATQDPLLMELNQDVLSLVTDQNGNHVIQKCIEQVRPISRLNFFFNNFRTRYVTMSKHPYGCRVVQRVLENGSLTVIYDVMNEIIRDVFNLITDQYANYVVQHIVEHQHKYESKLTQDKETRAQEQEYLAKMLEMRSMMYDIVGKNMVLFSQHKFGSNVVECCLKYGSLKERDRLIDKILEGQTLIQMMKDPYANYVVQRVIDKANHAQVNKVVYAVQQNEASLKRLTYGKHIINKLKSVLP